MEFTKEELKVIKNAVIDYENRNYMCKCNGWQRVVNDLIEKLSEV